MALSADDEIRKMEDWNGQPSARASHSISFKVGFVSISFKVGLVAL